MSAHVQDCLSAYLDEALSAPGGAEVREHLRGCPSCARLLAELSAVDEAMRALSVDAPPAYFDSFASRVKGRLESERRRPWALPRWTWAVAAALILAVVTPLTMKRPQSPAPPLSEPAAAPAASPAEAPRPLAELAQARPEAPGAGDAGAQPTQAPRAAAKVAPPAAAPPPAPGTVDGTVTTRRRQEAGAGFAAPAPADAPGSLTPSRAEREGAAPNLSAEQPERKGRAPARQAWRPGGPRAQAQQAAPAPSPARPDAELDDQRRKEESAPNAASGEAAREAPKDASEAAAAGGSRPATEQRAQGRRADRTRAADAVAAPATDPEAEYGRLRTRSAHTMKDARILREAWRTFSLRYPDSPHADEARVRVIEAGVEVIRQGGDPADRDALERDAARYLEREDAAQKPRVRALVDAAGR